MFFSNAGRRGPPPNTTEYYEFMGVAKDASQEDIRRAYQKKARQWHPDRKKHYRERGRRNPGEIENFKRLQKIYEVLSNDDKRKLYDRGGEEAIERGPSLFDQMNQQHKKTDNFVRKIGVDLEDLYKGLSKKLRVTKKMICAGCNGVGARDKSNVQQCAACDGAGRVIRVLKQGFMVQQVAMPCDVCRGEGEKIKDPCVQCHGKKVVQGTKEVTLNIDPGQRDGSKVVLAGEADEEPGMQAGDIVFIIHQLPHERFERKGIDLYYTQKLSLRDALCGCQFTIRHLDGRELLIKLAAGDVVVPGLSRFVPGEGFPQHRQITRRGRLFLRFDIVFPKKSELTADSMVLLQKALSSQPSLAVSSVGSSTASPLKKSADGSGGATAAGEVEEVELQDVTPEMLIETEAQAQEQEKKEVYEADDEEDERPAGVQCAPQ